MPRSTTSGPAVAWRNVMSPFGPGVGAGACGAILAALTRGDEEWRGLLDVLGTVAERAEALGAGPGRSVHEPEPMAPSAAAADAADDHLGLRYRIKHPAATTAMRLCAA